ncbi:MAG: lysoplasmalogenase [Alcanivoracaceae bacterium]|nr:lysoplasmalogenase [Alcanivoracaceae bacterium]
MAEVIFSLNNSPYLIFAIKPLLMPSLIVWAFLFAAENKLVFNRILILALIFSLFGDVSLMLLVINPDIFIIGLACFLIAHIIYIVLFIKIPAKQKSILRYKPYLLLPYILYGALLILFLYQQNHPDFIKLQAAIIMYAIVILTMLIAAVSLYGSISLQSYKLITVGALLFILSDSTIALSKFSHLFEQKEYLARIIIMALYGTAQFLIVKGYISSKIRS